MPQKEIFKRLDSIDKTLLRNTICLENLAKDNNKTKQRIKPLETHIIQVRTVGRIFTWAGILSGLALAIHSFI